MLDKPTVFNLLLQSLNDKIEAFEFALDELSRSVMNETKSTAGDKHETALAMLQSEQSRIAQHLYEVIDQRTLFSQIDITSQNQSVQIGSLVKTNKGTFLIGVATQGILVKGIKVFGISALSPLGQKLLGKKTGDSIEVNGMQHKIETID